MHLEKYDEYINIDKSIKLFTEVSKILKVTSKMKYDCIASSLVYHHVNDKEKLNFLFKIYNNIKTNGKIILGDCFINNYSNEKERNNSFKLFYKSRVDNEKNNMIREMQKNYLNKSLSRTDEWKTSIEFLIAQLKQTGFSNIVVKNVGNQKNGGYKIVIAEKIGL